MLTWPDILITGVQEPTSKGMWASGVHKCEAPKCEGNCKVMVIIIKINFLVNNVNFRNTQQTKLVPAVEDFFYKSIVLKKRQN